MSDIHKLTERLLPGETNTDLVDALERLTEQARKGEITAVAWACTKTNGHVANGWEGAGGTMFPLGAAIMTLHARYADMMME